MKLPISNLPKLHEEGLRAGPTIAPRDAIRPQGCCVESCVKVPGVGKVCKCEVSAPIC
jgi:hypothetical protein